MKDQIIEASIRSLQQEGLRFSVDVLAEKLKISKKTVYKYFPTKEALAYAMYEKYYLDLNAKIQDMTRANQQALPEDLLLCYFDSAKMVRKEIFNKYCLNNVIGDLALQHHLGVWNTIRPYLCKAMSVDEAEIYHLIIDGAFDKAIACNANAAAVIGMLRKVE